MGNRSYTSDDNFHQDDSYPPSNRRNNHQHPIKSINPIPRNTVPPANTIPPTAPTIPPQLIQPYLIQPQLIQSQLIQLQSIQLQPIQSQLIQPQLTQPKPEITLPGCRVVYSDECDFITDTSCCICFEEYYRGMDMQILPCNHIIHRDCLKIWYQRSNICPICRMSS